MPSNTVVGVYNQLIGPDHKVMRGSIGISFQAAAVLRCGPRLWLRQRRRHRQHGHPQRPGRQGRSQAQDVITSVDGKPIKNGDELVR